MLTIIADFVGMVGGWLVALPDARPDPRRNTGSPRGGFSSATTSAQGLLKPFVFAIVIALVGCFYGMRTTGGTQGVGRATTQAVVVASVWIVVLTFIIGRVFVSL